MLHESFDWVRGPDRTRYPDTSGEAKYCVSQLAVKVDRSNESGSSSPNL